MSLLMDALRRSETKEEATPSSTDTAAEQAQDSATEPHDSAELQLEPLNAAAELIEELENETDAFVDDKTSSTEPPGPATPQNQARAAATLAIAPANAGYKKTLYFLSGFVTIITIIGGYYLMSSDQTISQTTPHTATLIDAPVPQVQPQATVKVLPAPTTATGKPGGASVATAPAPAFSNQPEVNSVNSTDTPATAEVKPVQSIKIHKSRKIRSVHPLTQKAYSAYQQQNYTEAEQLYRQVLKRNPKSRDAALGLAAIAMHQGNHRVARYYYQRVLKSNPADKTAQIAMNSLESSRDNLHETSQLKHWLQDDRDNAQLHFALGNRYSTSGQWKEAQQAYFEALRIDPGQPDYAFNLAVSLDQLGLHKQALEYYRNARLLAESGVALFSTQQLNNRIRQLEPAQGNMP